MASITRSGTRRGAPVTMRLTRNELTILLRALILARRTTAGFAAGTCFSRARKMAERLIAEMELFFHNEESGSTPEVTK